MRTLLLIGILISLFGTLSAQTARPVSGEVRDSTGLGLPGATVRLFSAKDTLATITNHDGKFAFSAVKSSKFQLAITFLGFDKFEKSYTLTANAASGKLPLIVLKDMDNYLEEVVVNAVTPVIIKEDTVQYDARAYPVREGDAVDEMVKRLPGMEVSTDGQVTAQGQPVTKIRLNGKDFFGDDATAALQNLPADIVKNIQLVDDYGDEANITGVKSGEPQKILNINTQDDKKNGYFARAGGGLGSADRYNGRLRANRFKGERQLSLDGTNNNVANRTNGSTESTHGKLNYRDKWSEKLEGYGSYRFNRSDGKATEQRTTESTFQDYTRLENENSNNRRRNQGHNLSWNLEYAPDTSNFFKLKPNLSYSSARNSNTGFTNTYLLSASSLKESLSSSGSSSISGGAELFYNHKFGKKGRYLSVNAVLDASKNEGDNELNNVYTNTDSLNEVSVEEQHQQRDNESRNNNTRLRLAYSEPLGPQSFIEFNYQYSKTSTSSVRNTSDVDQASGDLQFNPAQSNHYEYSFLTNRMGFAYRYTGSKLNYFGGLALMPAVLKGHDLSRNNSTLKRTLNWTPAARLVYKFSDKESLTARYNGRSNQPGFSQLQPVNDNSDIQNVVTGNPDLKPEFTNRFGVEYKQTDWGTGYIFTSELEFNQTSDKIVSQRTIIPDSLRQVTSYTNTDGFFDGGLRYSVTKPFSERKYTLTFYGSGNYSNNIAFTNASRIVGKNMVLRQGIRFRADIPDVINADLNTSYSYNQTKYSSDAYSDRGTHRYRVGLEGRTYFFKDLTLGYDFSKEFNRGYNADNVNPTLLNLYLEYRFLKRNKASMRLQGFDVFDQNTGISRDVFDNVIVDSRTNGLSRFFMLSFQYRLQQFGV